MTSTRATPHMRNIRRDEQVMSYITRFDQVGRDDVDVAGGKGANLGELARARLPVPPGFVLTTAAYQEFVQTSGIGAEILTLAAVHADAGPEA